MMQAITNDEKYKPGVDMIADNRNLKQRIDALESENEALKKDVDFYRRLYYRLLDMYDTVEKKYVSEVKAYVHLSAMLYEAQEVDGWLTACGATAPTAGKRRVSIARGASRAVTADARTIRRSERNATVILPCITRIWRPEQ